MFLYERGEQVWRSRLEKGRISRRPFGSSAARCSVQASSLTCDASVTMRSRAQHGDVRLRRPSADWPGTRDADVLARPEPPPLPDESSQPVAPSLEGAS